MMINGNILKSSKVDVNGYVQQIRFDYRRVVVSIWMSGFKLDIYDVNVCECCPLVQLTKKKQQVHHKLSWRKIEEVTVFQESLYDAAAIHVRGHFSRTRRYGLNHKVHLWWHVLHHFLDHVVAMHIFLRGQNRKEMLLDSSMAKMAWNYGPSSPLSNGPMRQRASIKYHFVIGGEA